MRQIRGRTMELPAGPPEWIHLVPYGQWGGHSVGPFEVTPAVGAQILANFERGGIDLVIDYEHQTIATMENGQPAPAAGWVDQLQLRDDGVWGHVREWTPRATAHLHAREYRYLSPVIFFDATDRTTGVGVGARLSSAALTNIPFFAGDLVPVISRQGASVNLLALLIPLLSLPADATEQQVVDAVKAMKAMDDAGATAAPAVAARTNLGDVAIKAMKWEAGIPEDAPAQLAATLTHKGLVPAKDLVAVQAELERVKAKSAGHGLVARALDAGKISPAMKDAFGKWADSDPDAARDWMDAAPVIVPLAARDPKDPKRPTVGTLTPTELTACKQLGLTEAEYIKARDTRKK